MPELGDPLYLDWCDREAAEYACREWHYADSFPSGKNNYLGVWESGEFIGAIIFGRGAGVNASKSFRVETDELCELVRVALTDHEHPVSQIVGVALRLLRKHNPGLELVISYADPEQDHEGTIYQAMNWTYVGTQGRGTVHVRINGKEYHPRTLGARYGLTSGVAMERLFPSAEVEEVRKAPKHIYAYQLGDDRELEEFLREQSKPYPG